MRKIVGPSPYKGGLAGVPRRPRIPRERALQEKTNGQLWDHPGSIFRTQDKRASIGRIVYVAPRAVRRRRDLKNLAEGWNQSLTPEQIAESITRWQMDRVERKYWKGLSFKSSVQEVLGL